MVKTPTMDSQLLFKFRSGDMLVFNPSTKAAILHAVVGIDEDGSEDAKTIGIKYADLCNNRYGVQCRMYF